MNDLIKLLQKHDWRYTHTLDQQRRYRYERKSWIRIVDIITNKKRGTYNDVWKRYSEIKMPELIYKDDYISYKHNNEKLVGKVLETSVGNGIFQIKNITQTDKIDFNEHITINNQNVIGIWKQNNKYIWGEYLKQQMYIFLKDYINIKPSDIANINGQAVYKPISVKILNNQLKKDNSWKVKLPKNVDINYNKKINHIILSRK